MAGATEKRTRNGLRTLVPLAAAVVGSLGILVGAWVALQREAAATSTKVEAHEKSLEVLRSLPAAIEGIRAEQRAQRKVLDRVDLTLADLAKPK